MRKLLVLQLIYLKRLFRKKSYLVLLILIPLVVLGLKLVSERESGVLRVILCAEDESDDTTMEIIDGLLDSSELISYEYCDDTDDAKSRLLSGNVDAVWIFQDDLEERINRVAEGETDCELVEVVELEDTTSLKISREALFAALYDKIAYAEYAEYTEKILPKGQTTEEEMRSYYEYYRQGESLFELKIQSGEDWTESSANYMTAPIRGLLAILILLAGIAGCMYFRQDREQGVYDYLPEWKQLPYKLTSVFISLLPTAVVSVISLYISGGATDPATEIISMIIYILACMVFCSIIDGILENLLALGVIVPFLVLITLALCPVFFGLNILRPVQYMLPTFYYLKGVYSITWRIRGAIYTGCGIIVYLIVYWAKKIIRRMMLIHGRQVLR